MTAMRNQIVMALAPHIGSVLTPDVASAILANFPAERRPLDLARFPPRSSGSLVFAAERLLDILQELEPLHRAQWEETERYHGGIEMDPDINAALRDEMDGKLLQLTVRHAGELVGHLRMYVGMRSRHTRRPMAVEDTIYIKPEFRGGRAALRLLQYMEACLRELGIEEVYLDDKISNPAAGRLCDFLGYQTVAHRRYKQLRMED